MADYIISIEDSAGGTVGTPSSTGTNTGQVVIGDNVLTVNGASWQNLLAEEALSITVEYANGDPVTVTLNGDTLEIPNPTGDDATATITDSAGTTLYTLTIPSGGTQIQAIPDSPVTINTVDVGAVKATATKAIEVVKKSDGTTLLGEYNAISGKWEIDDEPADNLGTLTITIE